MENELIKIKTNNDGQQLVSAKELYLGLGLRKQNWSRWYPTNIQKNDFFKENIDWIGVLHNEEGNETMDFAISLEFAKHIAMMARTEKSHQYRNYFIECEQKSIETQISISANKEIQELKSTLEDFKRVTEEIWKDIKDYEGLYQVSNLGRVRSLNYNRTNESKVIKETIDINGYAYVDLSKRGEKKRYKVHRLVADTFISKIDSKDNIDHINTIRTDNRVENLRWCTHKENMNNKITKINLSNSLKGRTFNKKWLENMSKAQRGAKHHNYGKHLSETTKIKIGIGNKGKIVSEETKEKLREYKGEKHSNIKGVICLTTNEEFVYIRQATEKYGINASHISDCCKKNGKRKSAGKHPITGEKMLWEYT